MAHIETNDIDWVKKHRDRGYRSDPLGVYPNAQGKCPICGKKWIVVKGKIKRNCDCGVGKLER